MNRSKIYIGIAVAILLVALWMWWSKRSKKGVKEAPASLDDKPTPLAVDITPEETDVTWSAQEIAEEEPLKEE